MLDTDLGVLSVLSLLFYFPATLAQDATLRGCANSLLSNGTTFKLTNTDTFSQYIHCIYQFEDGNGGTLQNYHWYDYQNYTLYHYPNTPLPLDSHPACPTTLPLVSVHTIPSEAIKEVPTNAIALRPSFYDCRTDIWRPEQVFHLNDVRIQPLATDKCLDVTDGVVADGVKVQVWTCFDGNQNQQWGHWLPNAVSIPRDHITWKPFWWLCVDLTDGSNANGTPIQLWACNYQNPNQSPSFEGPPRIRNFIFWITRYILR
ncbi:hypothetical protein CC1G_12996 [Coprinopsis cinerea okayama7|uniref:Ricin B lectin domain-containing protein n=1 Tax=Coprinopsis cinerea (strain Okayama-7 / 130 / ATCC MYA-4618 / FGSC 9003) TaxID=240176 RepID=A8P6V9_COPC7|nr:hypothetical protein CC1G_12996 [Coprinopsis cinerea okayama7\|eukprot:XP_001839238.2 hypothetical protein CC1G_12996 [Coprinopsis cinerea okayama7\